MENKHTITDLYQMQSLPLEYKVMMTKQRIKDWYDHFDGNVYVSFSGGKDSTVLAHLVREVCGYKDVPIVYVKTGLESGSVDKKGEELADVVLRPEMSFLEVITKYGYPVISKEVSQAVDEGKRYIENLADKQTDRQTDDSICVSHSRFSRNRQTSRQRQRVIQGIETGEYP